MDAEAGLDTPDGGLDRLARDADRTEIRRGGKTMVFRAWGPPAAPGLVFLHGGSGSWRHWVRNIPAFAEQFRVVAPDLPGYGDSDEPDYPAELDVMGALACDGLDAVLGPEARFHLVAFSFGGSMCSQILRQRPGRQLSVTLSSPAGLGQVKVPPLVKVRGFTGAERVEAHRANLLSLMISDPAAVDALALRIQEENTRCARMRALEVRRGQPLSETLKGTTMPVAAIWGRQDNFLYPGAIEHRIETLRAARPDAVVELLDGAGHWLAFQRAPEFNAFLARNIARAG